MINREIKAKVVNVVSTEGKGLTQMSLESAISLAEEQELDVILLNDKCDIPVVKIGDYGKMLYEKQKKDKENKKKQRLSQQDLKEIQISDAIAEHDLIIKAKNVDRILKSGDKVMLVIKYKGRSIRQIGQGPEKLQQLAKMITVENKIEKLPEIEGNRVSMVIVPK